MNYYFDFDNTLYETAKLTHRMKEVIVDTIYDYIRIDKEELTRYADENFNSTLDNIFSFAEKMADFYEVDSKEIIRRLDKEISCGKDYVFGDVERFLKRLKAQGDKLYILTYVTKINQEYQLKKIVGSKIADYFDSIIVTTDLKYTLDLDYKKGVFIDDDPRDITGLFSKNPIRLIRIRKPNNKRSSIDMYNKFIEEYSSFDDIKV